MSPIAVRKLAAETDKRNLASADLMTASLGKELLEIYHKTVDSKRRER
jgi:hypothetical protein